MEDTEFNPHALPGYGELIGKSLAQSAAVTAGMMVGALAVGFVITQVDKIKEARATKKLDKKK